MNKIQALNPARVAWCCEQADLTLDDLAVATGISLQTLHRTMDGEDALSVPQLGKIAAVFNRGLLFFLEPGPVDDTALRSPQFRSMSNRKPHLSPWLMGFIQRAERQRALYLSLLEEMDEVPIADWFPEYLTLTTCRPQDAAGQARIWLGLDDNPDKAVNFRNLREAVEARGIMVLVSNGYRGLWQIPKDSSIRGFCLSFNRLPLIAVKKQNSEGAQAFTLMHELGHLLLHRESTIDHEEDFHIDPVDYRNKETQANAFAGHVLVPDTFLDRIPLNIPPLDEVTAYDEHFKGFAKTWGVSVEVVLRRLMNAGRLPKERYMAYRSWKRRLPAPPSTGGSRHRHLEPLKMFGRGYVETVLDALHGNFITLAKASNYLDNLKIKDLRQIEATHHIRV